MNKNILIVTDEQCTNELCADITDDLQITCASTGEDGLVALTMPSELTIVAAAYRLPDMLGADFLLKAVEKTNAIPILLAQPADLIDAIETLQPFGNGNPEPVFSTENLAVVSQRIVGHQHRQMVLTQPSGSSGNHLQAINFNVDSTQPIDSSISHMVFKIRWNRWNGKKQAQLIILQI